MSRRLTFKQADVERTIKALKAAGETVSSVEILPDGTIRVLTGSSAPPKPLTPLQAWELEHGRVSK